jgi:Ca2+-binding EF-hand superfamily protein
MKAWKMILAALLALVFVAPGMAQDEKKKGKGNRPNPEETFKKMDDNSDGKVTKEEYKKWAGANERMAKALERDPEFVEKSYARIDTKKTGSFTLDDYKKYMEEMAKNRKKKDPAQL